MKASLFLLLATVVPFGWVGLGIALLWRIAMTRRTTYA